VVEIGGCSFGERPRETGTRNVRKGFGEPFAVERRTNDGSDCTPGLGPVITRRVLVIHL